MGQGNPRSLGLVRPNGNTTIPPVVFGDLGGETQIGVTVEPAGGSAEPTTAPVMLLPLPAYVCGISVAAGRSRWSG